MFNVGPAPHQVVPARQVRPQAPLKSWIRLISGGLVATSLLLAAPLTGAVAAGVLPAFPGAEGAGAFAVGGRGGVVCKVTNLNDSGLGSLRHCIEDVIGPRTVIFEIGGTIELKDHLRVRDPYITIAGQTAPGGGIQLKAHPDSTRQLMVVETHDVIVRYLRFRRGYTGDKENNVRVGSRAQNVIFDHLSMFWAENQNWSVWGRSVNSPPRNITLQHSILAEMADGRVNLLTGGSTSANAEAITDLDFHNNLLTNTGHRNPLFQHASARWVNNIVYNWTSWASRTTGGVHADWISNLYTPGPAPKSSRGRNEIMAVRWTADMSSADKKLSRDPSLYIDGNRGRQSGMDPDTDNWPYTREAGPNDNGSVIGPMPSDWRRYEPLPVAGVPITVRHADDLEDHILPQVGASRKLDCKGNWVSNRDEADERVITEYLNNQGVLTERNQGQEVYGGHPVLVSGMPCKDTSGDGVPDEWAIANDLDPTDPAVGATVHASGYTYLEMYLNGMRLGLAGPASPGGLVVE